MDMVIFGIIMLGIIILAIVGYCINDRRFRHVHIEMQKKIKDSIDGMNTKHIHTLQTDLQQSALVDSNSQTLSDIETHMDTHVANLSRRLDNLKYIESEDVMRTTSDLTGVKTLRQAIINDLKTNVTGMESTLTSLGVNINILGLQLNSLPEEQRVIQIEAIKNSIMDIQNYDHVNSENISNLETSLVNSSTDTNEVVSDFDTVLGSFAQNADLDAMQSHTKDHLPFTLTCLNMHLYQPQKKIMHQNQPWIICKK